MRHQNDIVTQTGAGVSAGPRPVVHLELRTGDLPAASVFYATVLGWRAEWIETRAGSYLALDTGGEVGGGIAHSAAVQPLWLPYVAVDRIEEATERARRLGASVALAPRECPSGWRSVVSTPGAGEIALWQPKDPR
jgi:predicted enzyme related to lactoylglutathione lyase